LKEFQVEFGDRPPRKTLLTALNNFDTDGSGVDFPKKTLKKALDLGCGCGRDTVALLQRGWYVQAIDAEAEGLIRLLQRTDIDLTRLSIQVTPFEAFQFPENLDLINASFSLPFCHPQYFGQFWQKLLNSLRPGGRFCGHFFGRGRRTFRQNSFRRRTLLAHLSSYDFSN
jgi:SAM-dependent methyltransferase